MLFYLHHTDLNDEELAGSLSGQPGADSGACPGRGEERGAVQHRREGGAMIDGVQVIDFTAMSSHWERYGMDDEPGTRVCSPWTPTGLRQQHLLP